MMTLDEMQQITLNHWRANFPAVSKWNRKRLMEESRACAELTRLEMDAIKTPGMTEQEAWSQSCHLFCLTEDPPR